MLVVSIVVMLATMVASFIFPPLAIIAAAIAAGIAIIEFVAMGVCNIVDGKPFWDRDVSNGKSPRLTRGLFARETIFWWLVSWKTANLG